MPLENLVVRRACLHEVHRRADDRNAVPPTFGERLLELGPRGREVFQSRVVSAFRSGAKCMQMAISSYEEGSVTSLGSAIVHVEDREFVQQSRQFANLLASAQTSRQYPGGLVVVFDGTVGYPAVPYFAIMKAELHDAFLRGTNMQATFVDSVFLSPKTKLYKIGLFVAGSNPPTQPPDGWTATVYDSQLTATARDSAALYFHETFLGLRFPENSAHQTKSFYETTKEFINSAPLAEEQKVDLHNGLYSYLRLDQSETIQFDTFAETYMRDELGDSYRQFMRAQHFPDGAILKDISEIRGRMRIRKFRFRDQITLSGPAEAIKSLVRVEAVQSEDGEISTRITINGRLESQV